ncbi:hypothetical protein [Ruegeria atlantica]|uniref:hypothetical protein n=1 Tax=Ruegeria atlantica TaxID=81569 RepID=UPI001480719C|nr:hypothetical protein [Ruegeria atlantica]
MNKIDSWMTFLIVCGFLAAISIMDPAYLGDDNNFLEQFVNHNFLSFMGIFVTITLASTANIHIELRRKERKAGEDFLPKTRAAVRKSAFSLILALFLSLIAVVVKPLLPSGDLWSALANSFVLSIIFWSFLVVWDITKLAFKI